PGNSQLIMAAHGACGPEIPDAEVIEWRQQVRRQVGGLDLRWSGLSDSSLLLVPVETEILSLEDLQVTNAGISHLLRLTKFTRLNLSGTAISDAGLDLLGTLSNLRWLGVERTNVTNEGVARLQNQLPNLEVKR